MLIVEYMSNRSRKSEIDKCDCNVIHKEVVNRVRKNLPDEEALLNLAELFKVFGDTTPPGCA